MKICVTGGAGFIGSHLVDRLVEQGNEVVVIDNLSTGLEQNVNPAAIFLKIDLSVRDYKFEIAFDHLCNCDQIYHLAATVGYKKVLENPLKCFTNNIDSLKVVIEACELRNTKVLFTSSSEVYGLSSSTRFCMNERDSFCTFTNPQNGKDCYAISKWVGEFLLSWNPNINSVIVRLFNTSGARQRADFGMVLPSFVKAYLKKEQAIVTGTGMQKRCFCHVDDVVGALIELMNTDTERGKVFNVGNKENNVRIGDLCFMVGNEMPIYETHDNVYKHRKFTDSGGRVPNTFEIEKKTGWKPKKGLDKIINDNREWQEGVWKP